MRTYRTGFVVAIIGNIILVGVVVVLWRHSHTPKTDANKAAIQETNVTVASVNATATTPVSPETPLVPVQLSPQKLQSIGVKTGEVRRETVADEISSTGNVAVDETRL